MFHSIKRLSYPFRYNYWSDKKYIEKRFYSSFGYALDLNNPKTYNEKIQWLKLNDRQKIYTQCSDKLKVRDLVGEQLGYEYLIPLVASTESVDDITFDLVPERPVVIKPNHVSGVVYFVKDKNNYDFARLRNDLKKLMTHNYYHLGREWAYKNIRPKILLEELIIDASGSQTPNDYKFHCFDGEPELIHVDSDRFGSFKRSFFDSAWNRLPFNKKLSYEEGADFSKPANFDLMMELCRKLAKPFPFVRVDFYDTGDKVYFGELTFYPGCGYEKFRPEEWDLKLGDKIPLRKADPKY